MGGTGRALCAAAALAGLAGAAAAEGLQAGARVLIRAEGREDYTPRVVNCGAPTGLCFRDTRGV